MISRYVTTLAIVVLLASFAASTLPFATRAQVLSGKGFDETRVLEFTLDADSSHTYEIDPHFKQFLESKIDLVAEGPVRIVTSSVDILSKDVSWTEGNERITSAGAQLTAHMQWNTAVDSANGAHGVIYIRFPELSKKTLSLHSGGYQKDNKGRYVLREVTTYRSNFLLGLARLVFALAAGLPVGIVLTSIAWIFVLKKERRSRLAELPAQGPQLPQTFYPNPIVEWGLWTLLFGIGGALGSLFAGLSMFDGLLSSSIAWAIYIALAICAALALIAVYFTRKRLLTVRVESSGIAYARGRGDLQWLTAAWGEILQLVQKSRTYRGNTRYWVEIEFKDKRKKLKLTSDIEDYPALRDLLLRIFATEGQR